MDETGCVSKPDKKIKMKCVVYLFSRVMPTKKENTDTANDYCSQKEIFERN